MGYAELLIAYLRVRPVRPKRTLIEVAGQANKEYVWSRLLAHFLDPREGHGMSPLFLHALTREAGDVEAHEVVERVDVEVQTSRGKLIDVMVTTDRRVIAIENKIYAPAYNDFDEYRRETIGRAALMSRRPLMVLLTLHPADRSANDFRNVLWNGLRQQICAQSGPLFAEPVTQHTLYLQEFMAMVGNVYDERKVEEAFAGFVLRHQDEIAGLMNDIERLRGETSRRSDAFARALTQARLGRGPAPGHYREKAPALFATTYLDLPTSDGTAIAIDVVFEPQACRVEVFCRRRSRTVEFLPRLKAAGVVLKDLGLDNRHEWERTFDPIADPTDIAAEVSTLIDTIDSKVLSAEPGDRATPSPTRDPSSGTS